MEYQKIINLLDNTPDQPSKFMTKNWVKINDDSRGTYNINNQSIFTISVLQSILCNYSDANINVKGTLTVPNTAVAHCRWNSPWRGEGAYLTKSSQPVHH